MKGPSAWSMKMELRCVILQERNDIISGSGEQPTFKTPGIERHMRKSLHVSDMYIIKLERDNRGIEDLAASTGGEPIPTKRQMCLKPT